MLPGTAVGRDTAYRVIADHVRTLSTAIADGALPSNEGRGYVLRRILRRAVRYGRQMLGAKEGFFAALVPSAIATLAPAFPELAAEQARVVAVIEEEEAAFSSMLARGIKEFNARAEGIKKAGGAGLDGEAAFFLYDSDGLPARPDGVDGEGGGAQRRHEGVCGCDGGAEGALGRRRRRVEGRRRAAHAGRRADGVARRRRGGLHRRFAQV